ARLQRARPHGLQDLVPELHVDGHGVPLQTELGEEMVGGRVVCHCMRTLIQYADKLVQRSLKTVLRTGAPALVSWWERGGRGMADAVWDDFFKARAVDIEAGAQPAVQDREPLSANPKTSSSQGLSLGPSSDAVDLCDE